MCIRDRDICIDRAGKVIYAAYDPEKTTITDNEIIKQATYLAVRYRFEAKYNAPKKEWGELTLSLIHIYLVH